MIVEFSLDVAIKVRAIHIDSCEPSMKSTNTLSKVKKKLELSRFWRGHNGKEIALSPYPTRGNARTAAMEAVIGDITEIHVLSNVSSVEGKLKAKEIRKGALVISIWNLPWEGENGGTRDGCLNFRIDS
jgi:hypothetical protein